jgi:hypothetical protein
MNPPLRLTRAGTGDGETGRGELNDSLLQR